MSPEGFTALLEAEAAFLNNYSIGFVLKHVEGNQEQGVLGGSGTLASIDGVDGILTAEHVVRGFRGHDTVGLILAGFPNPGGVHRFVFKPNYCKEFNYEPSAEHPNDGPDLSFLVPPPDTVAELRARRSFYNLSKRRDTMLSTPPAREKGFWAIIGSAEEWTTDAPAQRGFGLIKVFNGRLLGPLERRYAHTSGDFDYIVFDAVYDAGYGGPESFGGYSGGGLWQFVVGLDGGEPVVKDRHLMGVAFYQSPTHERDGEMIRAVTCHGRESIYGMLIDRVRSGRHA